MKSEVVTDNMMVGTEDIIMKEREEVAAEEEAIIRSEMKTSKVEKEDKVMGMKVKESDDMKEIEDKVMIIEEVIESMEVATNKNSMTMIEELKVAKDNKVKRILSRENLLLLVKISLN